MLALERKRGQAVILELPDGEEIRVEVVRVHGNKIRLGFSAPRQVAIRREELPARERTHLTQE
mgnify:CR=1 FL=1